MPRVQNTLWGIVHISIRINDTHCTYINQQITGHLEAGESQTTVLGRVLYIAVSSEDIEEKLNNVYYVLYEIIKS